MLAHCSKRMTRKHRHEYGFDITTRGRRPLPKRGSIKSRISANAFHSIVSVLSRAS
ncbi:hypothetical protein ACB092_10G147900 [Castanea dentata]